MKEFNNDKLNSTGERILEPKNDKLRECPICGHTDLLYSIVDYNTKFGHTGCRACGISVVAATHTAADIKWNTRHETKHETVEPVKQSELSKACDRFVDEKNPEQTEDDKIREAFEKVQKKGYPSSVLNTSLYDFIKGYKSRQQEIEELKKSFAEKWEEICTENDRYVDLINKSAEKNEELEHQLSEKDKQITFQQECIDKMIEQENEYIKQIEKLQEALKGADIIIKDLRSDR